MGKGGQVLRSAVGLTRRTFANTTRKLLRESTHFIERQQSMEKEEEWLNSSKA